jgi:hypothetical protein
MLGGMINNRTILFCLALLLVVGVATALPPSPPAIPGEPLPPVMPPTNVVIDFPAGNGVVNETFSVVYHHTSGNTLPCSLAVNGTIARNATVISSWRENYTLAAGTRTAIATCDNGSAKISSETILFRVDAAAVPNPPYGVVIAYPLAIAPATLNVTFSHNISGNVNCSIVLDDNITRRKSAVAPNTQVIERYVELPYKLHHFDVTCANASLSATARRDVNVTNQTATPITTDYGLNITPPIAYRGGHVTITGSFDAYSTVEVKVESANSSTNRTTIAIGGDGKLSYRYTIPLSARIGSYLVTVVQDGDATTQNGTFSVNRRDPAVYLAGNRTNVTEGTSVVIVGEQFPQDDTISLALIGGGNLQNETTSDSDGAFSFSYGKLAPRKYDLTVRSVISPDIVITISFVVLKSNATVNTTSVVNTTPNTTIPPVIGPGNTDTSPTDDFDDQNTSVPGEDLGNPPPDEFPTPDPVTPPIDQNPAPIPDPSGSSGFGWRWILVLVAFVVIVSGTLGFFVYNGMIDVSSVDAFKDSFGALISGDTRPRDGLAHRPGGLPDIGHLGESAGPNAPIAVNNAENETIKAFIMGERSKGFDDLTIRGSLLSKGWDKNDVDRTFDAIYKEQSGP